MPEKGRTNRERAKELSQQNKENLTVRFGFRGGRNKTGRPDKNLTDTQRGEGNE